MRSFILCLCILLLESGLGAQGNSRRTVQEHAIHAAKNVLISTFDGNLPDISLEYFLKYESIRAPIDWTIVNCDERAIDPARDRQDRMAAKNLKEDRPLCVQ